MQSLTNVNSNLVFSDNKSKVINSNLNNGDIVFCAEDNSITLKYNNDLHSMGSSNITELKDASDTVKGITKLSDAVDSDDNTIATTSKAVKSAYDKVNDIKNISNASHAIEESIPSRIEIIKNLLDYKGTVIGIAHTGTYLADHFYNEEVAEIVRIDNNFNEVNVSDSYFDNHPSYQFEETVIGSDVMMKIPLCYWWRGIIPSGPFKGNWGMLLSPVANPGISGITFKPNYVAFMDKGTLKDCFYYGKYASRNVDGVPISKKPNISSIDENGNIYYDYGDLYDNKTFTEAKTLCANKGTGWHIQTLQEYHDIMARAAIEKCSFDIIGLNDYYYFELSCYRGIMELRGGPYNDRYGHSEFADGIRIPAGSSKYYQVFDNNGNRTWVNTNMKVGREMSNPTYEYERYLNMPLTWRSDQYFDNIFIANESVNYKDFIQKMICFHGQSLPPSTSECNRICGIPRNSSYYTEDGEFSLGFFKEYDTYYYGSSPSNADFHGDIRLAKI